MEKYISDLLYRYNCVTIPKLGAFLTQVKSAYIIESTNSFYPPSKELSFNEQLVSNDGLLVSYMAEAEKVSYEDMLLQVEQSIAEWKLKLKNGERLLLPNIGDLWLNSEEKIQFQPTQKVNYLASSFGLNSFVSNPVTREILKEEVISLEEKIPFIITPESKTLAKTTPIRPYLKYAAVILLALSTGFTGFQIYNRTIGVQEIVQQQAQEKVFKNIQEATFFNSKPMELSPLTIEANKKENSHIEAVTAIKGGKIHHIVAGAFRFKANADKKIEELRSQGYNAAHIGTNAHGLHQISYDRFTNNKEALAYLKKIKSNVAKEAWMLSVK